MVANILREYGSYIFWLNFVILIVPKMQKTISQCKLVRCRISSKQNYWAPIILECRRDTDEIFCHANLAFASPKMWHCRLFETTLIFNAMNSDLSSQLQNVLTTFPVLFTAFEIFSKPEFVLLFSKEFLLQLMNAWLHIHSKCSVATKSNRIWQLTFFALFLLIRVSVR